MGTAKAVKEVFVVDDNDRYSRLRLIGWWDQEKLSTARVLVVGAGALGNEVLKNLALVGIGNIQVIDFDRVQHSNLSRSVLFRSSDNQRPKSEVAAEMLRQLNPDCRVQASVGDVMADIGLGTIRDADVVIGCVDNREARLWINRMCWKVGTPWVDGGIQEINGVAKVFRPPDGPCYECGMTERDYQLIQIRYSCPLLKLEEMQQGKVPTAPTIASIIGGLQAQETLKLIHGLPTDAGSALVFNGAANQFYKTQYPLRDDCLSHEYYGESLAAPLTNDDTVEALFQWVTGQTGSLCLGIELDRDFLTHLSCRACDYKKPVFRTRLSVDMREAVCGRCGQVMVPESIHEVLVGGMDHRKLSELGVPAYDILKVRTNQRLEYVCLAGNSPDAA